MPSIFIFNYITVLYFLVIFSYLFWCRRWLIWRHVRLVNIRWIFNIIFVFISHEYMLLPELLIEWCLRNVFLINFLLSLFIFHLPISLVYFCQLWIKLLNLLHSFFFLLFFFKLFWIQCILFLILFLILSIQLSTDILPQ